MSHTPRTQKASRISKYKNLFFCALLVGLLFSLYQLFVAKEHCTRTNGLIDTDFYKNTSAINIAVRDWTSSYETSRDCVERTKGKCRFLHVENNYIPLALAEEKLKGPTQFELELFEKIKTMLEKKYSFGTNCRPPKIRLITPRSLENNFFNISRSEINLSVTVRRLDGMGAKFRLLTINGFKSYGLNLKAETYDQAFVVSLENEEEMRRLFIGPIFSGIGDKFSEE